MNHHDNDHNEPDNRRDNGRDGEQAWMRKATCARVDLPWTTDSTRVPPVLVRLMEEACARCPVLRERGEYVAAYRVTGGWSAGQDRDPKNSANSTSGEGRGPVRFADVLDDEIEVPAFLAHSLTRPYPGGDAA